MLLEFMGGAVCATAGLLTYGVRGRTSTLFGPSVWRGPVDRPTLALTFDDGPGPSTPEVLDLLAARGARATFFQCGKDVRQWPQIARAVSEAGHEIGNHGDTHSPFYLRPSARIYEELARAQQSIQDVTGQTPVLFRAPFGCRWFGLRRAQRRLGLRGVMWTAIGLDWKLPAGAIAARLAAAASNGAIFCLHDAHANIRETIEAVRRLIPELQSRGFQFETVSELLCPTN
jgi:peptidoglycan/xylan/chitin deacetylase (PgdA/CDA1 family)